ncbi:hypothetical protein NDU88_008336 [Pleurodeles waltl]|uniref:Uncharacterized protein n=1 Tax=Pleurodeles waltl TaxID=8319 RepID=A0AAV7RSR6_PLEWA|nr:hypothetical protein NDU88_008336 [Pleurodeles waltl]
MGRRTPSVRWTLIPGGDAKRKIFRQTLTSTTILQGHCTTEIHGYTVSPFRFCGLTSRPQAVDATDRILQEITVVGWCLEAMDLKILDLSAASTSIRTDIACFCEKATDLDQRLTTVEDHIATLPEQDAGLRSLRAKITDLEDRSRRDNVHFFGIA